MAPTTRADTVTVTPDVRFESVLIRAMNHFAVTQRFVNGEDITVAEIVLRGDVYPSQVTVRLT